MITNGFIRQLLPLLAMILLFGACSSPKYTSHSRAKKKRAYRPQKEWVVSKKEVKYDREAIVAEAQKYMGITYRYGGKHPKDGFDCSGLTTYVYQSFGVHLYGSSTTLSRKGKYKSLGESRPGDLAFFGSPDKVTHVAIVASNSTEGFKVIHCTSKGGVRKDDVLASDYWRDKYLFTRDVLN